MAGKDDAGREKRKYARLEFWFPVRIDSLSRGRTNAIVADASAGGLLIDKARELVLGEAVSISFEVPGEGEKYFLGKIRRIENGDKGQRVAIAFVEEVPELEELFRRASNNLVPV